MIKKISLLFLFLIPSIQSAQSSHQGACINATSFVLNLGLGLLKNGSFSKGSFSNPRFFLQALLDQAAASHKDLSMTFVKGAQDDKEAAFCGDFRVIRDWKISHSFSFWGVFAGLGLGGGRAIFSGSSAAYPVDGEAFHDIDMDLLVSPRFYFPLGVRIGYALSRTKFFFNFGYAPQRFRFSMEETEDTHTVSQICGSFFIGVGFSTPVFKNLHLGISAERFFSRVKIPNKLSRIWRSELLKGEASAAVLDAFDQKARKASFFTQTRLFISLTYVIPSGG
jgi:hypothetical protein